MWLSPYEQAKPFDILLQNLWMEIRPLYHELHCYVRRKLRETYGSAYVSKQGPIPAHLVGKIYLN